MRMIHELKTWPKYFDQVWRGEKTFEVRRDDRGFAVGDELLLRYWDPESSAYSGMQVRATVTSLIGGGQFGIEPGYVVMSLGSTRQEFTSWPPVLSPEKER